MNELIIYGIAFIFGAIIVGFLLGFAAGRASRDLQYISEIDQEDLGREESVCR